MARHAAFPPKIYSKNGYSFCRVKGEHRHLGKEGSEQARAAYAALLEELTGKPPTRHQPVTDSVPTVGSIVAQFMTHAKSHYSNPKEIDQYRLAVQPLLFKYRDLPAADFGPKALKVVRSLMVDGSWRSAERVEYDRKRGRADGWCRNQANHQTSRIKTVWGWAESEELVPKGSTAALRTVKRLPKNDASVRHTKKRVGTTWEDLQTVLIHCPPAVRIMLELQWHSGMRSKEVRTMTAERIDTSGDTWTYFPGDKNAWREGSEESPRCVQLGPECQRLLISWVDMTGLPKGPLFQTRQGREYRDSSYCQSVRRACAKAGVKLVPYQARHSAKDRVASAFGLDAARAFLGQHSIQVTAHYGSQDAAKAEEVARKVG